jgi:hypothetical protein
VYRVLEGAYARVETLGLPLAVGAWLTVFGGALAMLLVLRRSGSLRGHWGPAALVGIAALAAHLLDYAVTLRISPTLGAEGNPIWRIAIEHFGLGWAKLYGLTGKLLLSILSFELFCFYRIQRARLFPERADGFRSFWRGLGVVSGKRARVHWPNLLNFFAFTFALLGPFFFYVALLNSLVDSALYLRFPAMPLVLVLYLTTIVVAYFVTTYHAWRVLPSKGGVP